MNEEQIPLKSMGTQSRETMNMAAAMTPTAVLSRQREFEDALAPLGGVAEHAGAAASTARSKVSHAANWAMGRAKDTLRTAADHARRQTTTAVGGYIRDDPLRAVLIAAGLGALLMSVLSSMTRSQARAVDRKIRR